MHSTDLEVGFTAGFSISGNYFYVLIIKDLLFNHVYVSVHMRLEEETFDPLELNHMVWVLGTELSPL